MEKCQCRELGGYLPREMMPPASRCGACVDRITEEKNALVRENALLRDMLRDVAAQVKEAT